MSIDIRKLLDSSLFNESNDYCDLTSFINFVDALKSKINNFTPEDKKHSSSQEAISIYNIITDPELCVVSGSSVLYKRLGLPSKANDIDLFINATDIEIITLFSKFFKSSQPVFKEIINTLFSKDASFYAGQMLSEGFDTYNMKTFNFQNKTILSYRVSIANNMVLNLIFIYPIPGLKISSPEWFDAVQLKEDITELSINHLQHPYQTKSFLVMDYIWINFDFQELKFFYDFKTKEITSVIKFKYQQEKMDNDTIQALVEALNQQTNAQEVLSKWDRYLNILATELDDFNKITSGFDQKLTLSSNSDWNNPYIPPFINSNIFDNQKSYTQTQLMAYLNIDPENITIPIKHLELLSLYFGLRNRISKYSQNGFQIADPRRFIMTMQLFMIVYNFEGLTNKDINKINRYSFLNFKQSKGALHLFKFISKMGKEMKELLIDMNLISKSEDKEDD
jgi:hypothetical protein